MGIFYQKDMELQVRLIFYNCTNVIIIWKFWVHNLKQLGFVQISMEGEEHCKKLYADQDFYN